MGCFLPAVLTGEAPGCRRDGDVVGGGWRRPCGGEHGERNEQWVLRTGWGEQRAKEHGNMGDGGGVVLTRRNGVVRGAFEVDVGDVFVQKRCKTVQNRGDFGGKLMHRTQGGTEGGGEEGVRGRGGM